MLKKKFFFTHFGAALINSHFIMLAIVNRANLHTLPNMLDMIINSMKWEKCVPSQQCLPILPERKIAYLEI